MIILPSLAGFPSRRLKSQVVQREKPLSFVKYEVYSDRQDCSGASDALDISAPAGRRILLPLCTPMVFKMIKTYEYGAAAIADNRHDSETGYS